MNKRRLIFLLHVLIAALLFRIASYLCLGYFVALVIYNGVMAIKEYDWEDAI